MTQPHKDVPEGMQLIRVGSMSTATYPADCNHLAERPEQTIGGLGSFALVTNNVIGPGIMSLPALFRDAGVLPTSAALCFVCCCASLCGTFLSQTIAAIPGILAAARNISRHG